MSIENHAIALGIALCLGGFAAAQQQPAPLSVQQVKPGVYWAGGGAGANTGILVGKTEVAVIDAKMTADSAQAILAEIAKLTPLPLRRIILTHSDGDHVNGLVGYPEGLRVLSHANARGDMEEAFKSTPALLARLPKETTTGNKTLDIEGLRVELLHFGRAHTDGDLVVWLPEQKVAFVGDLIFIGREPLIHMHKRGTSLGVVNTFKKLLELDAETYISGHAPPVGKAEIRTLLSSMEERQAKIGALIKQGKSLDEIKKEFGVAEGAQRRPGLVEVIYRDLGGK
jgi:cyclase